MLTTGQIQVRPLAWQKADIDSIQEIETLSFNRYDAYSLADFKRWYHYNPDLCFVAVIDGRVAGYVMTRVQSGSGDLASLAVHPDFRKRGAGAALLAATEDRIKGYGINEITLEVRKTNLPGLGFWGKMGFIPFGTFPGFYEDGEDAIRMRKRF